MAAAKKKEVVTYITPPFRGAYLNVFEATQFQGSGRKTFNLCAIFTPADFKDKPKEKARWDAIQKAVEAACKEVHGKGVEDAVAAAAENEEKFNRALNDGGKGKRRNQEGFGPGTVWASIKSEYPPGIVGPPKKNGEKPDIISEEEGNADEIYPGAYYRAKVTVYAYNKGAQGVALGLRSLQKLKDGPRLDSRGNAQDDFDEDVDGSYLDQDEEAVDIETEREDMAAVDGDEDL